MVQRRFASRAVTALDADIQVQLTERPATLLVDLNALHCRRSIFAIVIFALSVSIRYAQGETVFKI